MDASLKDLAAVLLQDSNPFAFASKALTDVETRHVNLERELITVVYEFEKFHTYLCGRSFTVNTYNTPLGTIHLKHLTAAHQRIKRMLLRLQPYDLVIRYTPGKSIDIADALSRVSSEEKEAVSEINVQVHDILPQFSNSILQRFREQ